MIQLGPYVSGEVPTPLRVTFKDSAGAALDLTGYTATWEYRVYGGATVSRAATVPTPVSGITQYTWVLADLLTAGDYEAEMWVTNGVNTFASQRYYYRVALGLTGMASAPTAPPVSGHVSTLLVDGAAILSGTLGVSGLATFSGGVTVSAGPLNLKIAAPITPSSGLVNIGSGPFDGSSAGFFVGNANGTMLAVNLPAGNNQHFADWQIAGVSKFSIDTTGRATFNAAAIFNKGLSLVYDDTVSATQAIVGEALKTGLVAGTQAVLHLRASNATFVNDSTHDYNVAAFIENYTANAAGLVVLNQAWGDGLYLQTADTTGDGVSNSRTSWGLNITGGLPSNTAAVGDLLHLQRFGAGAAISIVSNAGAGVGSLRTLADDITVSHANNSRFLLVSDTGGSSANLFALTRTAATSGHFFSLLHATSTMTGDVIHANMASGSGAFSGKFADFQVNSVSQLSITAAGRIDGGSNLLLNATTGNSVFFQVNGVSVGKASTAGILALAGTGFDVLSAGALGIGANFATSVTITPVTTLSAGLKVTGGINLGGTAAALAEGTINANGNLLLNAATGNSVFFQVNGASIGKAGTSGILAATGTGFDVLSAGSLTIGGTFATSVIVTPATTHSAAVTISTGGLTVSAGGAKITGGINLGGTAAGLAEGTINAVGNLLLNAATGNSDFFQVNGVSVGKVGTAGILAASGTGFDVLSAGSSTIGGTFATSVVITPATTLSAGATITTGGLIVSAGGAKVTGGLNLGGTAAALAEGTINANGNLLLNATTGNTVFFQVNGVSQGSVMTSGFRVIAGQGYDTLTAGAMTIGANNATSVVVAKSGASLGFYGGAAAAKPTVTGSRGGNAALASLLTSLAGLSLLTDSTTA